MWTRWVNVIHLIAFWLTIPETIKADRTCDFPTLWNGTWIDLSSGLSIEVDGSFFGNSKCLQTINEKYLVTVGSHLQCIRIVGRHNNLLEYQEGEWSPKKSDEVDQFCSEFPTKGVWHTLLKKDVSDIYWDIPSCDYKNYDSAKQSISCKNGDKYDFTYNRGRGECKNTSSLLERCRKLTLSFGSCPELGEAAEEPFTYRALASYWGADKTRYFIAQREGQDTFHCFAYKEAVDGGHKLILSANASCSGLDTDEPAAGTTVLSLLKPPVCDFPKWLTDVEEWRAAYDRTFRYSKEKNALLINQTRESRVTEVYCVHSYNQSPTEVKLLLRNDCCLGPSCAKIHYRSEHYLEWQSAEPEQCASETFDWKEETFLGLLASSASVSSCLWKGLYNISSGVLAVGCAAPDSIGFSSEDGNRHVGNGHENGFSCYASWSEGHVVHTPTMLNDYEELVIFNFRHDKQGRPSNISWSVGDRPPDRIDKNEQKAVLSYRECDANVIDVVRVEE